MVVSSNLKVCATCKRWGGNRHPADMLRKFVEFNSQNDKGVCYGGTFNLAQMSPMSSCGKWEPQYDK